MYQQLEKNLSNSNISPTCPHNIVNFVLLAAEIGSGVLGTPSKFQQVSRLGSVTAWHSSSGRQPNFVALNRGRHLYSAGRPSRWALAHILVDHALAANLCTHMKWLLSIVVTIIKDEVERLPEYIPPHHHNRFTALFPGPPG